MSRARIVRITGALVEAFPLPGVGLYELAWVGGNRLMGEVVRVEGERATLQVYEETTGLRVGEPVEPSGRGLCVRLGPGLLGSVLDGVGRPLFRVAEQTGDFIQPGAAAPTLDPAKRYAFLPAVEPGTEVAGGDVLGRVEERPGFLHPILVPPGMEGKLAAIRAGAFTVGDSVGSLEDGRDLALAHEWPVRNPRPAGPRLPAERPFLTGQRIFDFLFPVAEGGSVSVPGGFGTGKTVIEQSLAKHADCDVVVFVGCGERGNEIAEVLGEFPRLVDARTGRSILERMVLVVNTSNMPVAAREASVYLGITIGEYFRDMGLRVAVLADSLSRWAEAIREMGSRLQEIPGEEGYPTYLVNRLGKFYERSGRVAILGRPERTGALTFIGAISPPGGDFSEPVTQASLRVAGALWALDVTLAHQRQFPAVDWETSYSLHAERLMPWFARHVGADWPALRRDALELLQRDRDLREIAALVGPAALQDRDRLVLETAWTLREAVLGQSAYDPKDAVSSAEKTYRLAALANRLHRAATEALSAGASFETLRLAPARQEILALRDAGPEEMGDRAERAAAAVDAVAPGGIAP
jgi:V/A-type H+-transporting ATPase subunit A